MSTDGVLAGISLPYPLMLGVQDAKDISFKIGVTHHPFPSLL